MPIYEYQCEQCCHVQDAVLKISELETAHVICDECKGDCKRIISKSGATHGDEAAWLASTTETLKGGASEAEIYHNPVASRTEYKKLCKEKGFTPIG